MLGKKVFTSPYKLSIAKQTEQLMNSEASFSLYQLALVVKANDPNVRLIDVRSEKRYQLGHLPNAINVPMDKLFEKDNAEYIEGRGELVKVLYAENESEAIRANALLMLKGFNGFRVLDGGYSQANSYVVNKPTPSHYHYTDELMRYSYNQLMPDGGRTTQPAKEVVTVDVSSPRGGC